MSTDNVVAVIRSAGERTLEACQRQVERQVDPNRVHVIQEIPFEAALQRCYEIGVASDAKWLLTIDADVILLPTSLHSLLAAAEAMPASYLQIEGRIFDKVFGTYRQAGHRLYRTSLLPLALKCMPDAGEEIRPEFATVRELGRRGYSSRHVATVVGVHDFEQNYRDLYRKAVVHAKKHAYQLERLVTRCASRLNSDQDFLVILKGFWDGLLKNGSVPIDARFFESTVDQTLAELGLQEKQPFDASTIANWEQWIGAQFEFECDPMVSRDLPPASASLGLAERFRKLVQMRGLLGASRYSAGAALEKIGSRLKG